MGSRSDFRAGRAARSPTRLEGETRRLRGFRRWARLVSKNLSRVKRAEPARADGAFSPAQRLFSRLPGWVAHAVRICVDIRGCACFLGTGTGSLPVRRGGRRQQVGSGRFLGWSGTIDWGHRRRRRAEIPIPAALIRAVVRSTKKSPCCSRRAYCVSWTVAVLPTSRGF
jgi:hypothetical protein